MANVFISHRRNDSVLAEKLAEEIKKAGHDVWLDIWAMSLGDQIVGRMNEGLTSSAYLVLCYSSDGMAPWINIEWTSTLSRQLNGEKVKILPVKLSGDEIPPILAGIKYADLMKDWSKGIAELLRAVK